MLEKLNEIYLKLLTKIYPQREAFMYFFRKVSNAFWDGSRLFNLEIRHFIAALGMLVAK